MGKYVIKDQYLEEWYELLAKFRKELLAKGIDDGPLEYILEQIEKEFSVDFTEEKIDELFRSLK